MKTFCKTVFSFVLLLLLLSGCGAVVNPYHENFNCRAPEEEGRCVDTLTAYEDATGISPLNKEKRLGYETVSGEKEYLEAQYKRMRELLEQPKTPMLKPPTILRVLVLPYRGDGDELFMPRYTYLKVVETQWVLERPTDQSLKGE